MTELQRYLAEEVAEDHADGLISRREALRRLGLLGLGAAASASLLAAFLAEEAKARVGGAPRAPAPEPPDNGRRPRRGEADARDRLPRSGGPEADGRVGGRRRSLVAACS